MWIFIAQWVLIILVLASLIITLIKFTLKNKKEEKIEEIPEIKINNEGASTDLDTLYNLLKIKKTLNTRSISKAFNIPHEKALEWAKILENHDLVRIEYPTFSPPEVKIIERGVEQKE